jgi:hypothetical protein
MSDLLALALEAHGGLERWRAIRSIDATLSVSGGLWQIKGHPEGLPDIRLHLETDRPFVTIAPFGGKDRKGYFEPHRVWIEGSAGDVVAERADPRSSFAGHTLGTPWDELHELYFISMAMWNYLTTPFLFTRPGFEAQEIEPHTENGDVWRRCGSSFPPMSPPTTISRRAASKSSSSARRGCCNGSTTSRSDPHRTTVSITRPLMG